MGVKREKGYEFRGWKLGERVRLQQNGEKYTIIGFVEDADYNFIVLDFYNDANNNFSGCNMNVSQSRNITSYIETDKNYFHRFLGCEIEKIENEDNCIKIAENGKIKIHNKYGATAIIYKEYNAFYVYLMAKDKVLSLTYFLYIGELNNYLKCIGFTEEIEEE